MKFRSLSASFPDEEEGFGWNQGDLPMEVGAALAHREGFEVSNRQSLFVGGILIGFIVILLIRVASLGISFSQYYQTIVQEHTVLSEPILPMRGLIKDRRGVILARNEPSYALLIVPSEFPRDPRVEAGLLRAIVEKVPEVDPAELAHTILTRVRDPIILADELPRAHALELIETFADTPGVIVQALPKRSYPLGELFAHVVGYIGKLDSEEYRAREGTYLFNDWIGKTGVEASYESLLRGELGKRTVEVTSAGQTERVRMFTPPRDGSSLILTVDSKLTLLIEEVIAPLKKLGKAVSVVALDPRNGELLALVSQPTFDPNLFAGSGADSDREAALAALFQNPKHPLLFRPIAGTYPPGSTFKPLIALAALLEGVITDRTTVLSTGGMRVGPYFFPDWKPGGHGVTNLSKALAESVNTFFYIAGGGDGEGEEGLGVDRIERYARAFNFGETVGVDLPNEAKGVIPNRAWKEEVVGQPWFIGDTYHLAIGQGFVGVTPLQLATFTALLANRGTLITPHVLKGIEEGDAVRTVTNVQSKRPFEGEAYLNAIELIRQGLRAAVTQGSAKLLSHVPVTVAAKTGTAQFAEERTHAWLTAFAPYENPTMVLTILVEDGGEGSVVAAPLAEKILSRYFSESSF